MPVSPRTSHREFGDYIGDYEAAGIDPNDTPPEELRELTSQLATVFTSDRRRAQESAKALAPDSTLIADPLFGEAPLPRPRIPLLRMTVQKWAVAARILWHAGYRPGIEAYGSAKARARQAADILTRCARANGATAVVAHGYFNFLIGRELRRRGFRRSGSHRIQFWNAVTYEKKESPPGR